jgi:hypothetical protein
MTVCREQRSGMIARQQNQVSEKVCSNTSGGPLPPMTWCIWRSSMVAKP